MSDDLIKFEEQHPELQEEFLEKLGFDTSSYSETMKDTLESQEYWDFVQEEFNNYKVNTIELIGGTS